jgi:hypothetical protein
VLVLDMIEILPPLGKYKYDTRRILPVKCYIDNSVHLQRCIQNINSFQFLFSSLQLLLSRRQLDFHLLLLNHRGVQSR